MKYQSKLTIHYQPLSSIQNIGDLWLSLDRYRSTIFLSWKWMDAWLHSLNNKTNINVLRFSNSDNKLVGIAFIVSTKVVRRICFPVTVLTLNETLEKSTNYTIEYNNILFNPDYKDDIYFSFFDFFGHHLELYDEIQLNAIDDKNTPDLEKLASAFSLKYILDRKEDIYFIDFFSHHLKTIDDYLRLLSKNKREQIRRSRRFFVKFGDPKLTIAENPTQALSFFHEMKELHQLYWLSKNNSGSFANPNWVAFHEHVINNNFENVFICKISFGDYIAGYLYNMIDNNSALSIQSGFNYALKDNKNRPGIVAHLFAIESYILMGFHSYNFLAGPGRYKKDFSNTADTMTWCILQNSHKIKLSLENTLLRLYRRITKKDQAL